MLLGRQVFALRHFSFSSCSNFSSEMLVTAWDTPQQDAGHSNAPASALSFELFSLQQDVDVLLKAPVPMLGQGEQRPSDWLSTSICPELCGHLQAVGSDQDTGSDRVLAKCGQWGSCNGKYVPSSWQVATSLTPE